MDSHISWKKAYGGSLIIHAVVFGVLMCFLAGSVAQHEEEKMYVIDLDASELTGAGSGHAGGGGGERPTSFPINYRRLPSPNGRPKSPRLRRLW